MKKVLLVVALLIVILIGVVVWKFIFPRKSTDQTPGPQGLLVSQHSDSFNESMSKALNDYYTLAESFVNWDTAGVSSSLAKLKVSVDSIRIPEMQKDSAIYETARSTWEVIKADIHGMQLDTSLAERRADLTMLSNNLFDLLRIVKFDVAKVYYHECPMALNNYESSAYWLSSTGDLKNRRNPYLGLHDPKYGKSMLACGVTRDSIDFSADSTGK
ncbi:MAG TPA: DUF3347 domain-containing protein [Chitinophagaceae bacterium]|nr:DUF3347 domain-containing protein [Chitinophagaceae bacterium]